MTIHPYILGEFSCRSNLYTRIILSPFASGKGSANFLDVVAGRSVTKRFTASWAEIVVATEPIVRLASRWKYHATICQRKMAARKSFLTTQRTVPTHHSGEISNVPTRHEPKGRHQRIWNSRLQGLENNVKRPYQAQYV